MIDFKAYWKGRDTEYADELTEAIRANAEITVGKVNELLDRAGRSDINSVNSGWRPQSVNEATANAGAASRHLSAEACDLPDADRSLAHWCAANQDVLVELGLWCEDFRYTPTWVHAQIVPPKSGRRIYIPSTAKPADPDFPVTW